MEFRFTKSQLEKLSELCIDLAKALLIGSVASPVITSLIDLFTALKFGLLGLTFVYLSLKMEELKEKL